MMRGILNIYQSLLFWTCKANNNFEEIVDNLNTTDDREAGEESHGTAHYPQHVLELHPLSLGDPVKRGRAKVNPHELKIGLKRKI